MARRWKCWTYRVCKAIGLFALARWLTARRLRILCYHGLSFEDEHDYAPGLFMRPQTVRARLATLTRHRYPVLPLEEAVRRLRDGSLPPCATAITYDDGFFGNFHFGVELFREFPLPMTVYVTTYYVQKQTPIFRHVIQYLFWKTRSRELKLDGLSGVEPGTLRLDDAEQRERVLLQLIRHGETCLQEPERVALCRELAARLGMDYDALAASRRLSLTTADEIRTMAQVGIDVQLHTHRHQFPPDDEQVRREIVDNRAVLEPLVGRPCNHLCYPSGVYHAERWPALTELGITSATTCEAGLNDATTPVLGLRRFLDSETVQPIEFEAELSGFAELLRDLRQWFRPKQRSGADPGSYGH